MIRNLRWWIGGLLFASTVINYIDRQTLSVLAPYLKNEYRWSNTDFALVLIAFRVAYTIMQGVGGRLLDWLGTRRGLSLTVAFYSTVAMSTAFARGLLGFGFYRFLLGAGEGPNWPGAAKAVAEWFPDRERAWAVALFDSGSSVGGAVAPFLVIFLYHTFGTWRPAFLLTGSLGFLWLLCWRLLYRIPEKHPRLAPEELAYIRRGRASHPHAEADPVGWRKLLGYKQAWGIILGRSLLDPYWFLIAEWFAIYLVSKGFKVEDSVLGFWVPFLAADLGNFFGGGLSSYWIRRGWPVGKSRRTVLLIFGPSMLVLIPAAFSSHYLLLISLIAYATFAYAACSTMFLSLPADAFHSRAVASVSGLSGTGAGIFTLLSTYLIGRISDRFSFEPIIIGASLIPCVATVLLVTMVRAGKQPDPDGILLDF
ncbi:MAG TPA: MFS transporter [Bryobacteraceae bacterium]|nr:MFS transporter [Bryobacteraceae bacterium]